MNIEQKIEIKKLIETIEETKSARVIADYVGNLLSYCGIDRKEYDKFVEEEFRRYPEV